EDGFIDSIALAFRSAAGELEHATVEIAGLQSPQGAVAVRGEPPEAPPTDAPTPHKSTSGAAKMAEEASRRPPPGETGKARTAPQTESKPTIDAEPPKPAPLARGIGEAWDVVPVFYGTDRGRQQLGTGITYGSERARRLELGRALITVPKAHQLPNIERPWA